MEHKSAILKYAFRLHRIAQQLRGLAYLIKIQRENDEITSSNPNEIQEGIGLLLDSLALRIDILANRIEDRLLKKP
ncbi:MAG: hypothetical protein AB7F43_01840 [Bacteriovoracia bacterium]